jgi:hypothetical protein
MLLVFIMAGDFCLHLGNFDSYVDMLDLIKICLSRSLLTWVGDLVHRELGRGPGSPLEPGTVRPSTQQTSQAPLARAGHPCLALDICFFFRKQPKQLSARDQNSESGQENRRSVYF